MLVADHLSKVKMNFDLVNKANKEKVTLHQVREGDEEEREVKFIFFFLRFLFVLFLRKGRRYFLWPHPMMPVLMCLNLTWPKLQRNHSITSRGHTAWYDLSLLFFSISFLSLLPPLSLFSFTLLFLLLDAGGGWGYGTEPCDVGYW